MISKSLILSKLKPFENKHTKLNGSQSTGDIINAIEEAHNEFAKDYDSISSLFWGGSVRATCKNIFDFLKENCNYVIESDKFQTIRSPAAIVSMGKTIGNDCKNYSLFTGGILNSLQRQGKLKEKYVYRFAAYNDYDKTPTHVFVVCKDKGKEIWIDAVLKKFDTKEKKYSSKIDKNFMALYKISGHKQNGQVNGIVVKVLAAPVRNAFLLLVSLNVFGLGTKVKEAYDKDWNKTNSFWNKWGGSITALQSAMKKGSAKKRIFGIGVVEPVTASAAAAAVPLIVKFIEFLKSLGFTDEALAELGQRAKDGLKNIVTNAVSQNYTETNEQLNAEVVSSGELPLPEDETKSKLPVGLIVLGIGGLLLLSKKRK